MGGQGPFCSPLPVARPGLWTISGTLSTLERRTAILRRIPPGAFLSHHTAALIVGIPLPLVIPIVLILQFISGVYLQFYLLPDWMQNAASVFPLKWMAKGMRGVFLPDSFANLEQSGSRDFPLIALSLLIWLVVGLVLSRVTFRWIRKDT